LKLALVKKLKEQGVQFQENGAGGICYAPRDADRVQGLLIAIDMQQRPSNQITISGGELGQQMLDKLSEGGVEYAYTEEKNGRILVVIKHPRDKDRAVTLMSEAVSAFVKKKN
jgi:hypothetical protein